MSHASVVVFAASLEQAQLLLNPYSEQLTVDEYERPCYCVGRQAKKDANNMVDLILGRTVNQERDLFDGKHPKETYKPDADGNTMWAGMMERQAMWEKEYSDPRRKLEDIILDTLTNKDAAEHDCEECHGTGKNKTTYNPLSKHDYFTYEFSEPYGRGPWDWELALKPEDTQEDGKGKTIPFAIVTPMHGWQEMARLGWWGMTSDKKEEDAWRDLYFTAVKDALAMNLKPFRFDYHI